MKRTILGTFILAVIVAAGTLGAVAATDEVDQGAQVPNLCMEAVDSASMRVVSTGHTLSAHQEPTRLSPTKRGPATFSSSAGCTAPSARPGSTGTRKRS